MGGVAASDAGADAALLTVAGVGSRLSHDDAVGLALVEALPPIPGARTVLWEDADALTVADCVLGLRGTALIVDCADMGIAPGGCRFVGGDDLALAVRRSPISVHGLGLAEAISIARDLGFRGRLAFFGVQPYDLSPGSGLSPDLAARLPALAEALRGAVLGMVAGQPIPPASPEVPP